MRRSRKIFQRGFNFDYDLKKKILVDEGREDPNTTISGPSSAGQWNANIECWLGSFVVLQGIRASIAKKPYIFVIFQGEGQEPLSPLWIRTCIVFFSKTHYTLLSSGLT